MSSKTNSTKKNWIVKENTAFLDFVRITGAVPAFIWKRPKVYYVGDKKKCLVKGGVLIASNHVTFTDPILLYCVFWRRRLRFLATKDLYKSKFLEFLFSVVGCIQVDKENFNISTLHDVVDKLKNGKGGRTSAFQQQKHFRNFKRMWLFKLRPSHKHLQHNL